MKDSCTLADINRRRLIRYYRKLHGMNQADLALKLGVSAQRVYDWEKGARPSAKNWYKLCRELDIPPELQKAGLSDSLGSKQSQMELLKQMPLTPEVRRILEEAIALYFEEDETLR